MNGVTIPKALRGVRGKRFLRDHGWWRVGATVWTDGTRRLRKKKAIALVALELHRDAQQEEVA